MQSYIFSETAFAVLLGSIFQEILHWYGLRSKLHLKTNQALLKSKAYWLLTLAMFSFSVFGVYFWFDGDVSEQSLRDMFIFGAAFPLIFKSAIKSVSQGKSVTLGDADKGENKRVLREFSQVFRSYFER